MDDERTLSPDRIESIKRGIAQAHAGQVTSLDEVCRELGIDLDE